MHAVEDRGQPVAGDREKDYTVVIPTRGRRRMVLAALESVYAQTVPPTEVIVVVDGDSDGTETAVKARFSHARVLVNDQPCGPAAARNSGLQAATARWVCLLDDDDLWHSKKQEMFFAYLRENPGCRALRSGFWQFSAHGGLTSLNGFESDFVGLEELSLLEDAAARVLSPVNDLSYLDICGRSLELMLERNRGVTSSSMFRRDLLLDIPSVPGALRTGEDWLLFVLLAAETEWHLVPGNWIFYRVHAEQGTRSSAGGRWEDRLWARRLAWDHADGKAGVRKSAYSREYALELNSWIWDALNAKHPTEAVRAFKSAASDISDARFRWSVWLPPKLWRKADAIRSRTGVRSSKKLRS